MEQMKRNAGRLGLVVAIALCVGCASARVKNVQKDRSASLPRPARVVVFDFDSGAADVVVGSSPARTARRTVQRAVGLSVNEADLLGEAVADALASRLVADITAIGLPAERAIGVVPPALGDLVVQGQFVRIDEGSRTRPLVVGLGLSTTELRTRVEIFQVTVEGWRPIVQFDTLATGSRLPGAAALIGAGGVASNALPTPVAGSAAVKLEELRVSIDADARRTSEQISKKVSELSTAQRW